MKCLGCGDDVPANVRSCPGCGHPVSLVCPECGSPIPVGGRFCPACGIRVVAAEGAGGETAAEALPPKPPVEGAAPSGLAPLPPDFLFSPLTFGADLVLGMDTPTEQGQ